MATNFDQMSDDELLSAAQSLGVDISDIVGEPPGGEEKIVQEMHPELGEGDRFKIKNFGADTDTSINYLKEKYPGLLVDKIGGQIAAKRPEEKEWRVLDPDQGFLGSLANPLEAAKDVGDVAYDVGAGLTSGVATAGAGLGAGALTGGWGAIPAAMAAGGAFSGGLELLRQKLGRDLGVGKEDYDLGAAGFAAGAGALSPLLFGTGAAAAKIGASAGKDAVARNLLKKSGQIASRGPLTAAEKEAAKEALAFSQRGITKYVPEAWQFMGGTSADTIRKAGKKVGGDSFLKLADEMEAGGVTPMVQNAMDEVSTSIRTVDQQLKKEFGEALAKTNVTINLKDTFQRNLRDLGESIQRNSGELPDAILKDASSLFEDFVPLFTQTVTSLDGKTTTALPVTKASGETAMAIKQKLKDLTDYFADMEGKKSGKKDLARHARKVLDDLNQQLNVAVTKADKALGRGGDLIQKYSDHMDIQRSLRPFFETEGRAFNLLRTMDNKSKRIVKETIQNLDNRYKTKIGDKADLVDVWATFGRPSFDAVSSNQSTSTSRSGSGAALLATLGSALGHISGLGFPAVVAGGGIGATIGAKGFSPAVIKKALQTQQGIQNLYGKTGKAGDLVRQLGRGAVRGQPLPTAWNLMNERGE